MLVLEKPKPVQTNANAERLKALRKAAKWSQARMGEVLGYSQSHIDGLESGRRILTVEFDHIRNLVIIEKQEQIRQTQIDIKAMSKL